MVANRQAAALGTICLFPVLAALTVAARCYSRYLAWNYGWDDGLILLSLVLLAGQAVTFYEFSVLSHSGYHYYDIPPQSIQHQVTTAQWSAAVQIIYHPMMTAIRASIIMFLFRLHDYRRKVQIALHTVFWINIGYLISTTLATALQCTPVRYLWLKVVMDHKDPVTGKITPGGKCFEPLPFILASCGLSIFMDLIILPIPAVMVWNLQMRGRKKFAIISVMSMGVIATATSVIRFIVYYYRWQPTNKDRTWDIGGVVSIIEPSVAIITACIPALKRLFSFCLLADRHAGPRSTVDVETSSIVPFSPGPASSYRHTFRRTLTLGRLDFRRGGGEEGDPFKSGSSVQVHEHHEHDQNRSRTESEQSSVMSGKKGNTRELVYHGPAVPVVARRMKEANETGEPMNPS